MERGAARFYSAYSETGGARLSACTVEIAGGLLKREVAAYAKGYRLPNVDSTDQPVTLRTDIVYIGRSLLGIVSVSRSFRHTQPSIPSHRAINANNSLIRAPLDVNDRVGTSVGTEVVNIARSRLLFTPARPSPLSSTRYAHSMVTASIDGSLRRDTLSGLF